MAYQPPTARPRRLSDREEVLKYPHVSLVDAVAHYAQRPENPVTVSFPTGSATYEELLENAQPVANALFSAGVDRGGRCALVLEDGIDLLTAFVAVSSLGAAPVILDPDMPVSMLLRRVRDVRGDVVVCGNDMEAPLQAENHRVHSRIRVKTFSQARAESANARRSDVKPSREDLAAIVLSPGTAGHSAPVVFRHRQLIHCANAVAERLEIGGDDVIAVHEPLYSPDSIFWSVVLPAVVGIPSVHLPAPDPNGKDWGTKLAESEATILVSSDQAIRAIVRNLTDTENELELLRSVVSLGDAPRHGTIRDFETKIGRTGIVRPAFSLIEAAGVAAIVGRDEQLRVDSEGVVCAGRPLKSIDVGIFGESGDRLDAMTVGDVRVRGTSLFGGYFDDPARTSEVMDGDWMKTGDIGYLDEDGFLFVLGRGEDMIRTGDRTLVPRQIEESADRVHNVRMLAAIGKPKRGDLSPDAPEDLIVVAEINASASGDRDQMRRISENIEAAVAARVKLAPSEVLLVEPGAIPRTATGKIMYARLRYLVTSGRLGREGVILHGGNVFVSPLKR